MTSRQAIQTSYLQTRPILGKRLCECIALSTVTVIQDQTTNTNLELTGVVASGMEEGRQFISKSGYIEQFVNRLGYEPFHGTLNIKLDENSVIARSAFDQLNAVLIESWSDGETTFGGVLCYPVELTVNHNGQSFDQSHVIIPKRTDHGLNTLEIIAPIKLREEFNLTDGDRVKLHVQNR